MTRQLLMCVPLPVNPAHEPYEIRICKLTKFPSLPNAMHVIECYQIFNYVSTLSGCSPETELLYIQHFSALRDMHAF